MFIIVQNFMWLYHSPLKNTTLHSAVDYINVWQMQRIYPSIWLWTPENLLTDFEGYIVRKALALSQE